MPYLSCTLELKLHYNYQKHVSAPNHALRPLIYP